MLNWSVQKFQDVFGAMLIAASTDVDRPHLCSVRVERVDTTVMVAATDGHWLLRWQEPEGTCDDDGAPIERVPFACTVHRRTIEQFLGSLKKALELERVVLRCRDTPYTLETLLDVRRHEFLPTPEAFPDVSAVVPRVVSPTGGAVAMASSLMAKVAKAFQGATGDKNTALYMQMAGDSLSPLVVTSPKEAALLAVVMPRREAATNALPVAAE